MRNPKNILKGIIERALSRILNERLLDMDPLIQVLCEAPDKTMTNAEFAVWLEETYAAINSEEEENQA